MAQGRINGTRDRVPKKLRRRGSAHRDPFARLSALRPDRGQLQHLWRPVRAVLPARHVVLPAQPADPAGGGLQPVPAGRAGNPGPDREPDG